MLVASAICLRARYAMPSADVGARRSQTTHTRSRLRRKQSTSSSTCTLPAPYPLPFHPFAMWGPVLTSVLSLPDLQSALGNRDRFLLDVVNSTLSRIPGVNACVFPSDASPDTRGG
eukprot:2738723-Rhodomonas_salina.2